MLTDEDALLFEKFPGEPIVELIVKLDKALNDTCGATAEAHMTFKKLGALTVEQLSKDCKPLCELDLRGCKFHDWQEEQKAYQGVPQGSFETQLSEWKTDDSRYLGTKLASNERRHGIVHMVTYGCIVTRMYKEGKLHGFSRFIQSNGGYRTGFHFGGKMCSKWKFVDPDGTVRENGDYGLPVILKPKNETATESAE